jgi:hypothetical protein
VRGVFDAAASVYLDRFLNVPATRLPEPAPVTDADALLAELPQLLDQQQQVNEAAQLVVSFLAGDGYGDRLVAALGAALLREDRNFHTMQCLEAATRQHQQLSGSDDATMPLIAAARYLAAHATTTRADRRDSRAHRSPRGIRALERRGGIRAHE